MCGINGYFSKKILEKKILNDMNEIIKYRGPDDSGTFFDEQKSHQVAIGHLRLAIIDISPLGHQPYISKDKNYILTFNGEIYNFMDIRKDLENKGYSFVSQSDTEVLLYGYIEYKEKILHKLDGMFAFCIYNKKENSFFLARDRFGIKPLFYHYSKDLFAFSSQKKSLLKIPKIKKKLNYDVLTDYLKYRHVYGEETLLKNIWEILPGYYLKVDIDSLNIKKKKYYDIRDKKNEIKYNLNKIEELLKNSVKKRLLADVEVGTFLSGGVDSSLLTCFAKKQKKKLKTFSIGFKNDKSSELPFSDKVSKTLGTDHCRVEVDKNIFIKKIYEATEIMDDPFHSPNTLPLWILCRKAREKGVTVLLTGEGADELMLGYSKYQKILPFLRKKLFSLDSLWLLIKRKGRLFRYLQRNFIPYFFSKQKIYKELNAYVSDDFLYQNGLKDFIKQKKYLKNLIGKSPEENVLHYFDLFTYVIGLLERQDRLSMAVGVEVRVPYLDKDLVEYAVNLPLDKKINNGITKYPFKKISEKIFGKKFTYRKKCGFPIDLDKIMKENKEQILDDIKESGLDLPGNVHNVIEKYFNGDTSYNLLIYSDNEYLWFTYFIWALSIWYKNV